MNLWTIYDNPDDFPKGTFVARKFHFETPTLEYVAGKSLDEVRAKIPLGLVCLTRHPEDDPKIVEVWI